MFTDLFKTIDRGLARLISSAKVRLALYFLAITAFLYLFNTFEIVSRMMGTKGSFADQGRFELLTVSAFTAAVVLLFVVGAGGLLADSAPARTPVQAEISKIRLELNQLRNLEVPELVSKRVQSAADEISRTLESLPKQDLSNPEKIFQAARDRLMADSQRIDRISRRNLYFGIVFSAFALGALAWPLIAQTLTGTLTEVGAEPKDVFRWLALTYLPRFAVALLLQFVGFFFLRLYVANELDLKHNRNELTNLEVKMMALQLAVSVGDAASKKEIVRVLSKTERNFVLKKNEKLISGDISPEYNDLKALLEQVIRKIPTVKAS